MANWLLSWRGTLDLTWLFLLLALLLYFWRDRSMLRQIQRWLITQGHITRFTWSQEESRLWPMIEYTYEVSGNEFVSDQLFLHTPHTNFNSRYARRVAYRAALAYENEESIEVHYNPENPQQAVLDTTIPPKLNLIIGLLLALIVFHLGMIVYHLL